MKTLFPMPNLWNKTSKYEPKKYLRECARKTVVVVRCCGGRDANKRPEMGVAENVKNWDFSFHCSLATEHSWGAAEMDFLTNIRLNVFCGGVQGKFLVMKIFSR